MEKFILVITVSLIAVFIVFGILFSIDAATKTKLKPYTFDAVVNDKDMENGKYYIFFSSLEGDLHRTVQVSGEVYARVTYGDIIKIACNEYHSLMDGNKRTYTVLVEIRDSEK